MITNTNTFNENGVAENHKFAKKNTNNKPSKFRQTTELRWMVVHMKIHPKWFNQAQKHHAEVKSVLLQWCGI